MIRFSRTMAFILFLLAGSACAKQKDSVKTLLVSPDKTGQGIQTVHGPHLVVYDAEKPPGVKLFLMIAGTGADALAGRDLCAHFARKGYHTISLDYMNDVITTTCSNSDDSACFDKFRQEIMFGTDVSEQVKVDSANSIVNRFGALLSWLVANDPKGNWQNFISGTAIRWDRIAVGGHSQGAGHAAYFAENFPLKRALIFSGPQDYLVKFNRPAGWLSAARKTPASACYAFLHTQDQFVFSRQLAACEALMQQKGDTVRVVPQQKISSSAHIFITGITTPNAHMSTLEPQFTNVWDKMMGVD